MNVHDKLAAGAYKSKLPYPNRPARPEPPELLLKRVVDLTDAEFERVGHVRHLWQQLAAHEATLAEVTRAQDFHHEDTLRLQQEFRRDLEEYHGMTGHPRATELYDKAWYNGHADGLAAIAAEYGELVDLVQPHDGPRC